MRRFVMRIAFALSTLAALSAQAQNPPTDSARATARALAREGYEAQRRGQYALAADRFERAEALVDAPTLLLGLARAQVALHKLVEADETYRRILRQPLAPGAPPPFVKAVEEATRESAAVAARRAWVTLAVQGPVAPQVTLDDVPVPAAALGVRLACNPGSHVLKAAAPGFVAAERTFAVSESSQQTVTLPLEPDPAAQAAQTGPEQGKQGTAALPVESVTPEAARSGSSASSFGVPVLTVGIAGLALGAVTGIVALTKHSSLSDACPAGHCPASESASVSTYRALANVSTVSTILGAVATAAGITILVAAPSRSAVGVYVGPSSGGVAGRF